MPDMGKSMAFQTASRGCDVARVDVPADLVDGCLWYDCRCGLCSWNVGREVTSISTAIGAVEAVHDAVVPLVDVFVEVLHAGDRRADLHVHVGVVLLEEVRVVRDDKAVVDLLARRRAAAGAFAALAFAALAFAALAFATLAFAALAFAAGGVPGVDARPGACFVVRGAAPVERVRVFGVHGAVHEVLWETPEAVFRLAVVLGVALWAVVVDHVLQNLGAEGGLLRVRDIGADERVVVARVTGLLVVLEYEEHVGVR
jgi:hypothetical protein